MDTTLLVWGLGLMALALLLVVIDLFVPTLGALALTSLAVAIAGVVCLFRYDTTWGLIGSLMVLVGGPALAFVALNVMPHTPLGRRLVLNNPPEPGTGAGPGSPPSPNELQAMIGREGVVLSDLRPVGVIVINDQRFDALAEGAMLKAGQKVRVMSVADGLQLRVRAIA